MINDLTLQATTQCMQGVYNIGYTEFHNICTGTVVNVKWGALYWIGAAVFVFFIIFIVVTFINICRDF